MLKEDIFYIWKAADCVSEELELKAPISLNSLLHAIESLDGKCEAVSELSDGEACISTADSQDLSPKFTIRYIKDKPESRILFSIAHELGHLILHLLKPDGSIQECTTLHRGAQSTRKELEANEFAAALLMPAGVFATKVHEQLENSSDHNINISDLAQYFNVSIQAATVRGKILQLW